MPTDEELSGGIIGYGVSNIVCAFFSGLPTATYSQNVGIVSSTKVVAKRVFGIAAMIMLVCRNHAKDRIHSSNYSVMCAWRCNNLCICNDFP